MITRGLFLLLACGLSAWAEWPFDTETNLPVSLAQGDQQFVTLVDDGQGGVLLFWQDARAGNRDIYGQHLDAQGSILWAEDGIPICAVNGAQGWPESVSDGAGGSVVVWGDGRHGNQDIYAQRVGPGGELLWASEGVPVCVEPTLQEDIYAIPDGEGGVFVAWEDWRNGNQDIYAQHIGPDGTGRWGDNGTALAQLPGDQYDPVLTSDATGGVIGVWWDISMEDWNIVAQRLDAEGRPVWAAEGVSVCDAAGHQGGPVAVEDGQGGALVAWVDYRADPLGDLYAQRIDAGGSLQWDPAGIVICALPNAQQQPSVVSDGAGGLVITWWDERDLYSDIYAQRISGDGKILWQPDGVPVCLAEGVQREPQIVAADDVVGIVWKDFRDDYALEVVDHIFAQLLDLHGNQLWEPDGVPVTKAVGDQSQPRPVWIGSGLVTAWVDLRGGHQSDIYAQWTPR